MTNLLEVGKIYQTTDYSYFKKMLGNRDVEKYSALKSRIEEDGQISPVVINEKQEVIDGQHRLEILKELGRPVEFIVKNGADFVSVISMNTAQKNWMPIDYLNAYADKGFEDYVKIREFLYRHSNIKITLALCAAAGKRKGTYSKQILPKFQNGDYKITNYDKLVDFTYFYENLLDETLLKESDKLQSCLWSVFTCKNFDGKRLIQKVNSSEVYKKINIYKSEVDILKELVVTYNSNITSKNPKFIETYYNEKGALILPERDMEVAK